MFFRRKDSKLSINSLKKDIDRLFITQKIIKEISSQYSFDEIAKSVLNHIEKEMGYSATSMSVVDMKAQTIQLKYLSDSILSKISRQIFLSNESFKPISLTANPINNTKKAALESKIIIGDNVSDFIVPPLSEIIANSIQTLSRIKTMIALPIRRRDEVIAILNFSMGKDLKDITINEMNTLELFVDQIGLIIDNALKYEQIKHFNVELEEKIELATHNLLQQNRDLTALYNLSSRISTSLNSELIAQTAVNSLPQDGNLIGAILAKFNPETRQLIVQSVTQNPISEASKKILGNFDGYPVDLNNSEHLNNPSAKVILQNIPIFTNNVESNFSPPIPKGLLKPVLGVLNIKSIAIYPVYSRGKVSGTIGYLFREQTAESFQENQKQLLQTYSTQIGTALENAFLYELSQKIQADLEVTLKELKLARERERDMIDIMGHELRTPMSIVKNALGMMSMQLKAKGEIPIDKQKQYVDIGLESARRESNLIETLLSATKADAKGFELTFEEVDLLDVANDSETGFKNQAIKKGLEFKYTRPNEPISVYADRTRIQEICDNFVSNAVKYTYTGSVEVRVWKDDKYGWISVIDTGEGISKEDQQKLGNKFFRAQQHSQNSLLTLKSNVEITEAEQKQVKTESAVIRPGGTGLGLYVSFNLIKLMDGILKIESELGKGSNFTFGIPLYAGQPLKQELRKVAEVQGS